MSLEMRPLLLLFVFLFGVAADATTISSRVSLEERIQAIIRIESDVMRQELEIKWDAAMNETRTELEKLRKDNALLQDMCKENTIEKIRDKRQHAQSVAFHAYQSGEKCIHDMQTFVYENVLLNDGMLHGITFVCPKAYDGYLETTKKNISWNGYSPRDGIFDPPVSGVYVFTWTVADFHDWFATELVVDGVSRGATIADNDTEDIATGTAIVVLYVRAGSHVFVRRSTGGGCKVINIDDHTRNTFSGWLLY